LINIKIIAIGFIYYLLKELAMENKKAITIYDIAKAAGVSPGTVSRTLNNIGYIKEETRQKVEEAASRLKYTPNRAARTLKTKKTGLLMLAIPDTDNPFYVDMIKAVQEVAKHNGYSLVLYYTDGKSSEEVKALKMLHEHFTDGMILVNFSFTSKHQKAIEQINCPLVLSSICKNVIGGNPGDKFDYIGVDTEKGIYLATRHLIAQGHTDIGYVAGPSEYILFQERFNGYRSALIDGGIKFREEFVYWENYSETCGYKAAKYFLSLPERPTAICCANDIMGIGVLNALEDENIRVPEDISLISMDNIDIASKLKPKLSTVSIAQAEIGRSAAELIILRLNGTETRPSKKIIFEPRLVVRESSIVYNDAL
jgi:DNA-binding LacI/PurR family transcriptional regulator